MQSHGRAIDCWRRSFRRLDWLSELGSDGAAFSSLPWRTARDRPSTKQTITWYGSPSLTAASMKRWRPLLHGTRELEPPSILTLCCYFPTCGSIWRLTRPQPPDSVSFPKRACGIGSNSFVSSLIPGWSVVGDREE